MRGALIDFLEDSVVPVGIDDIRFDALVVVYR